MPGIISLREGGYGSWEAAVEHVAAAGIHHLEVNVRALEELETIARAAQAKGVRILTLSGGVNLDSPESMDGFVAMIEACEKLQAPVFFVSANGTEADRATLMARLRGLGEEAAARGVILSLETHPPFCQNADGMLQTLGEVNHPAVRMNLDTANIFYYNEGLDSADELERVVDHVASLHLKDTDGGFKSPNFPVLGQGVVRFERVQEILDAADFSGPLTIELEGPVVGGKTVAERHEVVVGCMDYLRSIGMA